MRKIIIEIETDSEESIGVLKQDLEQEISCCWNSFDMESMKVFEMIGASIERGEAVSKQICNSCAHEEVCCNSEKYCCDVCKHYEKQRPHGEWVEVGYSEDYRDAKYKCSKCETEYKYTDFINIEPIECFPNYCPKCGSDNRKKGAK